MGTEGGGGNLEDERSSESRVCRCNEDQSLLDEEEDNGRRNRYALVFCSSQGREGNLGPRQRTQHKEKAGRDLRHALW